MSLFPRAEYAYLGGIFGHKVLNALDDADRKQALKLYARTKRFYKNLAQDLATVTYQDIFRYGFSFHATNYGKLLKAENYDRFLPSSGTLSSIQQELIRIDIRNAIVYASSEQRKNVIGDIYGKLIDQELRDSIGAIYTTDDTVEFMVNLAHQFLGQFRGHKVVETACGSGHFYKQIYRRYVDEVIRAYEASGQNPDYYQAHSEALEHVMGRDIDPFAVQLTLLSVFLEQLKDNVKSVTLKERGNNREWKANFFIDCQNSLDPVTITPEEYVDVL